MIKVHETHKQLQKPLSKSKSKDQPDLKNIQKIKAGNTQLLKTNTKTHNKTKSHSKHKSKNTSSKDSKKQAINSQIPIDKINKQNVLIHNRKKLVASEDKMAKTDKFFRRKNKNNNNRISVSRKGSKKSFGSENEQGQIERLKAENDFYKNAFLTSKASLQKMQKYLQDQKKRRNNNKEWFKHQIDNLKKKISCDKIKLGHIFSFDSFRQDQISNMIIQTENQSSSLVVPAKIQDQILDCLSDLSIESK